MLCRYGPCDISDLQDRMKRAVALLGEEEVKNIMQDEGKIEVGYVSEAGAHWSVGHCAFSIW